MFDGHFVWTSGRFAILRTLMTTPEYPRDADGDALRRLVDGGSDLSKIMSIDFAVAVPDELSGKAVALKAKALGYNTEVVFDPGESDAEDDSPGWTCYCTREMVPTYEAIVHAQAVLGELSRPHEGYPDGWGSFGNDGSK